MRASQTTPSASEPDTNPYYERLYRVLEITAEFAGAYANGAFEDFPKYPKEVFWILDKLLNRCITLATRKALTQGETQELNELLKVATFPDDLETDDIRRYTANWRLYFHDISQKIVGSFKERFPLNKSETEEVKAAFPGSKSIISKFVMPYSVVKEEKIESYLRSRLNKLISEKRQSISETELNKEREKTMLNEPKVVDQPAAQLALERHLLTEHKINQGPAREEKDPDFNIHEVRVVIKDPYDWAKTLSLSNRPSIHPVAFLHINSEQLTKGNDQFGFPMDRYQTDVFYSTETVLSGDKTAKLNKISYIPFNLVEFGNDSYIAEDDLPYQKDIGNAIQRAIIYNAIMVAIEKGNKTIILSDLGWGATFGHSPSAVAYEYRDILGLPEVFNIITDRNISVCFAVEEDRSKDFFTAPLIKRSPEEVQKIRESIIAVQRSERVTTRLSDLINAYKKGEWNFDGGPEKQDENFQKLLQIRRLIRGPFIRFADNEKILSELEKKLPELIDPIYSEKPPVPNSIDHIFMEITALIQRIELEDLDERITVLKKVLENGKPTPTQLRELKQLIERYEELNKQYVRVKQLLVPAQPISTEPESGPTPVTPDPEGPKPNTNSPLAENPSNVPLVSTSVSLTSAIPSSDLKTEASASVPVPELEPILKTTLLAQERVPASVLIQQNSTTDASKSLNIDLPDVSLVNENENYKQSGEIPDNQNNSSLSSLPIANIQPEEPKEKKLWNKTGRIIGMVVGGLVVGVAVGVAIAFTGGIAFLGIAGAIALTATGVIGGGMVGGRIGEEIGAKIEPSPASDVTTRRRSFGDISSRLSHESDHSDPNLNQSHHLDPDPNLTDTKPTDPKSVSGSYSQGRGKTSPAHTQSTSRKNIGQLNDLFPEEQEEGKNRLPGSGIREGRTRKHQ